jgi:hypothetical protein
MMHEMVLGTSEPQDFQLLTDMQPLNGTGLTVGIQFRETGVTGVSVAWLDQAAGTVRVTGAENLERRTYHVRFTLTDGNGKLGYAPGPSDAFDWVVTRF